MTIWKFPLSPEGRIPMPEGAELLHVATQNNEAFLWARVQPEMPLRIRHLKIVGTGHECGGAGVYVGTFHLATEGLVFHVFDAGEEP